MSYSVKNGQGGTAARKACCPSCQGLCSLDKPLESALNVPGRGSSDCRARWECACSRELPKEPLPALGRPGGCSMGPLRGHVSGDPLPRVPRGAGLQWRKKSTTMGHKARPCAGQGATAGPAAREGPNSADLWDTRQWWHQPVSVVSSTVKGILRSMSDTFKAGRQEVSWGLLWRAINSKPSKERIPNCHFQLVVKVLSRPKTYWDDEDQKNSRVKSGVFSWQFRKYFTKANSADYHVTTAKRTLLLDSLSNPLFTTFLQWHVI